jgi:4-oxalocrotonate tautomerase
MPLVRIDLLQGTSVSYRQAIGQAVYEAMVETLKVPESDRFQVITEHPESNLICDPSYLGVARSPDCVFIQITLNAGRTVEVKRGFYARLADLLVQRVKLRREDVFVSLVEVAKENWSFGNGEAQYAA